MDQSKAERLSLRFEPSNSTKPSLEHQIQQLIKQKGALRHITRASLQAEINESETIDAGSKFEENDSKEDSEDETPQLRQEKLWKSREAMLQKLAYAQNEVLSALDFVSLLASGGSAAAQASMSPALKERVPVGSLDKRAVEEQDLPAAKRRKLVHVSEGWKLDSFASTSNKFGEAAARLNSEAQRQINYWEQIASVKTHGWSVSRLPSDSRAVGVHYGFREGAPQFRNRGFTLLQQNESGSLQLDARSAPKSVTVTRVSIIRDGVETGSSRLQQRDGEKEQDINDDIRSARDAIFEEELFYEISREARLIANQGARTQPNAVEADIDTRSKVRIEQILLNESQFSHPDGQDDDLAELVGLNMRLLLLLEHQKSKEQRCKPPSPMTLTPQATGEYAILRPVLAQLRHQASIKDLRSTCESFKNCFAQASIPFTFRFTKAKESGSLDSLQELRQPARSLLSIHVNDGRQIEVEVETYLSSPVYGTVFRSSDIDFGFVRTQHTSFDVVDDVVQYLSYIMTLELISQAPDFEVLRPHSGEVALRSSAKLTAVISVRPQRISLVTTGSAKEVYVWRPSESQKSISGEAKPQASFWEVVRTLGQKI